MAKKQKVKFHRGDRRPKHDKEYHKLSYFKRMKKKKKSIIWQVLEKPTQNVISEYFFEEDAQKFIDFQNKNRVWEQNGGIPKFLWTRI
jgi:N-acetylneuraminic acid mutarotase